MPGKNTLDVSEFVSGNKPFNERIHDLKETLIVIDGFVRDMAAGYKFDDALAAKKSELLVGVFSSVKDELLTLTRIYEHLSKL